MGIQIVDTGIRHIAIAIILTGDENQRHIINLDIPDLNFDGLNPYRITAIYDGRIIGGRYDPETALFTFNTHFEGVFTIKYIENLRYIVVQLDSFEIVDLAGNAPPQTMDVLPVIQYQGPFVPLRFIAEALGAAVGWDGDSSEVTISLDNEILTFTIGQIASGMYEPLQIINNRTFVPLHFVAEFFDAHVEWDESTGRILIIR